MAGVHINLRSALSSIGSMSAGERLDGLHAAAQEALKRLNLKNAKKAPEPECEKHTVNTKGLLRFLECATGEQGEAVVAIATLLASRIKSHKRAAKSKAKSQQKAK